MADDDDDTVVRRVLNEGSVSATKLSLIASDLSLLATVLAAYPDRHPEVWLRAEWSKDFKDLASACERLRHHAQELDDLARRMNQDG